MKNIAENVSAQISFLRTVPLFKSIDLENLEYLAEHTKEIQLPKYSFFYKKDEIANQLYIQGIIKISSFTNGSREVIKAVIHSEMTFNISCITSQNNVLREDAISMDKACIILAVNSSIVRELLRRNFQFTMDVMTMMSNKIKKAELRLQSLILEDARTRIINFLN